MVKPVKKVDTTNVDLTTYHCIFWKDAVVDEGGWQAADAAHALHEVQTVGWIIKETDEVIVVASDISAGSPDDGDEALIETNRRIAIPKDWIISRKKVKFNAG